MQPTTLLRLAQPAHFSIPSSVHRLSSHCIYIKKEPTYISVATLDNNKVRATFRSRPSKGSILNPTTFLRLFSFSSSSHSFLLSRQEMSSGELKQLCLQQLQLLSDATILNIINGKSRNGMREEKKTIDVIEEKEIVGLLFYFSLSSPMAIRRRWGSRT